MNPSKHAKSQIILYVNNSHFYIYIETHTVICIYSAIYVCPFNVFALRSFCSFHSTLSAQLAISYTPFTAIFVFFWGLQQNCVKSCASNCMKRHFIQFNFMLSNYFMRIEAEHMLK